MDMYTFIDLYVSNLIYVLQQKTKKNKVNSI